MTLLAVEIKGEIPYYVLFVCLKCSSFAFSLLHSLVLQLSTYLVVFRDLQVKDIAFLNNHKQKIMFF